ncbi:MAG: hypothetical protein SPF70_09650 [Lachnospiraceae bacterium]|nr:hypothetical protein [Lachnospiraceae bacterium]
MLRTLYSQNPAKYSHIVVLTPHFYAHISAGQKVFCPSFDTRIAPLLRNSRNSDLLTLVSS